MIVALFCIHCFLQKYKINEIICGDQFYLVSFKLRMLIINGKIINFHLVCQNEHPFVGMAY